MPHKVSLRDKVITFQLPPCGFHLCKNAFLIIRFQALVSKIDKTFGYRDHFIKKISNCNMHTPKRNDCKSANLVWKNVGPNKIKIKPSKTKLTQTKPKYKVQNAFCWKQNFDQKTF